MKIIKIFKGFFCCLIFIVLCAYISNILEDKDFVLNTYANTFKKEESYFETIFTKLLDHTVFRHIINPESYSVGKLVNSTSKPEIYIHNTHQTEEYQKDSNMKTAFTVYNASFLLKNKLEDYGHKTIIEEKNVKKVLNERKWDYSYSYRITKEYTEEVLKTNPDIKIIIDLHRDSTSKNISTTTIKGKNYAKIMFLLGQNHQNYQKNEKNINLLKSKLEKNYPSITRNNFNKKQYTYNQEISPTFFTIELGADKNTVSEVYNSINALAEALNEFLKESYEI